jgi:non-homologous end joining protein Ku
MIELAEHILETKAGHFDATEFEDRHAARAPSRSRLMTFETDS